MKAPETPNTETGTPEVGSSAVKRRVMRQTPQGWRRRDFDLFILECALRDREGMLHALGGNELNPDLTYKEAEGDYADETRAVIAAIRARMARLRDA